MSSVPRSALPGWSRSVFDQMAAGLGYFSLALGTAELIAPNAISRAAGLEGYRDLVRAYGVREIATGLAILASHDATPWVWGRVAGDAIDLATVAAGAKKLTKTNTLIALGMLAGVTALDIFCASRLSGEKGGVKRRAPITATEAGSQRVSRQRREPLAIFSGRMICVHRRRSSLGVSGANSVTGRGTRSTILTLPPHHQRPRSNPTPTPAAG